MIEKYDLTEYVDRLYFAAITKTGDSHVAEDIVQETFLAAIQALVKGKEPDNLWRWLFCIMSNKYCDWLREKYNKPQISIEDYPFDIPGDENPDEDDPDEESADKLDAIKRELGYLAQTHREVMIRFYMHGETIAKIANELHIPIGTVKSRLNTGRKHIREGVSNMNNYTKQSYEPDILGISCSGAMGLDNEPFSLVPETDKLTQNVLILAYPQPITETDLAKALGVPVVFIEPIIEKMVTGELMQRTDGGKVYTDFIIYTDNDRKATFKKQLDIVKKHFDLFWHETDIALSELKEKEYYKRQTEHAKIKLELHFCIKLLLNAHIDIRNEVTGVMPYSEYPYRKNGGRWFAMGQQYQANYDYRDDSQFWKYGISGEAGTEIKNFRDAKYIELRSYETELGKYPNNYFKSDYVKWFYELLTGISREDSTVGDNVLAAVDDLIKNGVLTRNSTLTLDIPIMTHLEYHDEGKLASEHEQKLSRDIHDVLRPVFNTGYVKLPTHLKSVPKWQQYMYCGDSVPMAIIHTAIAKGLLFQNVNYKIPASIFVVESGN